MGRGRRSLTAGRIGNGAEGGRLWCIVGEGSGPRRGTDRTGGRAGGRATTERPDEGPGPGVGLYSMLRVEDTVERD